MIGFPSTAEVAREYLSGFVEWVATHPTALNRGGKGVYNPMDRL